MASLPTIGTRVHGGMPPQACVEIAQAAERSGLAGIWFAENPFYRGVLPAVAAAAIATKRINIGIGVFNPFNRHPTLIAMEIGALDELAGGRGGVGIRAGIKVGQMGVPAPRPLPGGGGPGPKLPPPPQGGGSGQPREGLQAR